MQLNIFPEPSSTGVRDMGHLVVKHVLHDCSLAHFPFLDHFMELPQVWYTKQNRNEYIELEGSKG